MAATRRRCPSWADLQPELVGLVLGRLPSLADRVRLAAVCRPWRHSARLELVPPPFPWLTLRDGTCFLSIPDGKIYCLPSVPPHNHGCVCSVGNWLFLQQQHIGDDGGSRPLSLMNPFSKDVVRLPNTDTIYRGRCFLLKLVLLSPMDLISPDYLFAVLIAVGDGMDETVTAICHPSTASAFRVLDNECIYDVEFVDGKLYAFSHSKLFVLEVESSSGKCKPKISYIKCIANNDVIHQTIASEERTSMPFIYLAQSNGKLLLVTRLVGGLSVSPEEDRTEFCRTFSFYVFEVDLNTSSSVQWRRVNSLEGKALFVGPYSKTLHASENGAQADCIYFMSDRGDCPEDPFRDSGVFNVKNGTITPLLPETMMMQVPEGIAKEHSTNKFYPPRPSWFFPC